MRFHVELKQGSFLGRNEMLDKLRNWLKPTDQMFKDFEKYVIGKGAERRVFVDRGADVLFVAHLDTVQKPKYKRCRRTKKKKMKRIYAQGLDDRLGCLIAWELSKELGADLLLTDNEEKCQSTAKFHDCKEYNWVAEFDRGGGDVVTYELNSPEFVGALEKHFEIGFGSYSDICDLKSEACCVNVGIGYELAHSRDSYVVVKTMEKQIERFRAFYEENKGVKYVREGGSWYGYYWVAEEDYEAVNSAACDVCGIYGAQEIYGYRVCEDCFCSVFEGQMLVWK